MTFFALLVALGGLTFAGCAHDVAPGTSDDGGASETDGGVPETDGRMPELPPDTPPTGPIETLEDQLRELGIDVDGERAQGRRLDADTVASEDWAPLGREVRLAPRELFLVGPEDGTWRDADPSTPDGYGPRSLFVELWDESRGAVVPATTFVRYEDGSRRPTMGARPDNSGTRPGSQAGRAAAAADFDGDGREEAFLLRTRTLPSGAYAWQGMMVEDAVEYAQWELEVLPRETGSSVIRDLALVAGEMTGDAHADALAVYLKDRFLGLVPFPGLGDGHLDQRAGLGTNVIELEETTGTRSVEVAQGNLDFDPALETIVLLRTWDASLTGGEPTGRVRFFLYDDFSADPFRAVLLADGDLALPDHDGPAPVDPLTAGVAIADFDGDGLDEIAFAGLTRLRLDCQENHYGVTVLDDLEHARAELARATFAAPTHACTTGGEGTAGGIYEVMARALEWDGDHPKELLVNERVLDLAGDALELRDELQVLPERSEQPFSHASHAVATADVTHDGLDEVIVYSTYEGTVAIRGHQRDVDGAIRSYALDLRYGGGEPEAPLLVPFDNDDDGQTLRYVPASHRLELSEPIVHAVLAAPPCAEALGQDLSECTTTYGSATTSGVETSETTTGSVAATVGVVVGTGIGPFTFEASYQATVEAWTSATTGSGYELTYSVDYTTHGRDAVVFTSVPYDVYEYEITRSFDPAEVGEHLAFLFPRRPITRPVSVKYFNDRVRPGGLRIDLGHTAGDPTTYRTRDDVNALESAVRGRDPSEPFAFLKNGPRDVGTSTTAVGVGIEIAETRFVEEGYGVSRSHSVEVTGGVVVAGVTVGSEDSATIQTSMSSASSFHGEVPGIDDSLYGYAFGMFTYMGYAAGDEAEGQTFQVVDYWVE